MRKTALIVSLILLVSAAIAAQANLRLLPDGAIVEINSRIVVDTYGYNYSKVQWIQMPDRLYGIRLWSPGNLNILDGDLFSAKAYKSSFIATGEPVLVVNVDSVVVQEKGCPLPRPIGMSQRALTTGISPFGNLIRLWGKVPIDYSWFHLSYFLDDGSNLANDAYLYAQECSGIKVYDWQYPLAGDWMNFSGVASLELSDNTIFPVFHAAYNQSIEPRGPNSFTVSGTVTANSEAAGKKPEIITDSAKTQTTPLDANGAGSFYYKLPKGNYTITASLLGYKTNSRKIVVNTDLTGIDFTLVPLDPKKVIDITSDFNVLPNDGQSTVEVKVIVRDLEGRPYSGENIFATIDKGAIISPVSAVTDNKGWARFTVRSTTNPEGAIFTATSGNQAADYWLAYADIKNKGPLCWPEEIMKDSVVRGDVQINLYLYDFSDPLAEAENALEAISMNMREYVMMVDGQVFWRGAPFGDERYPAYPYPIITGLLETEYYSNGPHVVTVKVVDGEGNIFTSPAYSLIFNNEMYGLAIGSNGEYRDEVDLAAGDLFHINASFQKETHWRVCGYDLDSDSERGLGNELIIAEGTGSQLSSQWDGRLPGYASDETRNDLVFIEVQLDSDPSESAIWVAKKKRQVNVKSFPDSEVQILLVQGFPVRMGAEEWRKDFVGVFPFRSECFYERGREKLGKARRLGHTVADWPRVKSILLNGKCRMWYFMGHSLYAGIRTAPDKTTYYTQIWLKNGLVLSKAIGSPAIGVGNLTELNMEYSTQLLFVMFDGCKTGQGGGTDLRNPPFVPANRRNDVAQVLGMYIPTAGGRVYIGWRGDVSSNKTTSDFIGAWDKWPPITAPGVGMFDLWSRSTGRVLSYVIGNYPNSLTCPYILNSANQPQSKWPNIWRNMRIYGSGDGVDDNMGMNLRMFSLIP